MKGEALSLLSTTRLPKSILWLCGANKISQDSKLHCIRASVTCQTGLKKTAKTELPIGALRGPRLDPTQLANGFSPLPPRQCPTLPLVSILWSLYPMMLQGTTCKMFEKRRLRRSLPCRGQQPQGPRHDDVPLISLTALHPLHSEGQPCRHRAPELRNLSLSNA